MIRKVYAIILIWMVAFAFIYFFSKQKIIENSTYIEGIIDKVVCLHPTKRYLQGYIQIYYNKSKESIKFQTPILKNNNFDKGCKKIKNEIKAGMKLKAQTYNTMGLITIGNVFIDNKKIRDFKNISESSKRDSSIGIYITILIAMLMTIFNLLDFSKKAKNNKHVKKVFYFLGIWAVIKSLFNL